jgi:predicted alternative tryptophan synthase beta-subunit
MDAGPVDVVLPSPRPTPETGAGQWGTALSLACRMFDLECTVYMVKAI